MTVSSESNSSGPFACNGSQTLFTFDFAVLDEDDVVVVLIDTTDESRTTLAKVTDYTIALTDDGNNNFTGGTITTTATYSSGFQLFIYREVALTQPTDLTEGPFFPEVIEDMHDRSVMQAQQLSAITDRAMLAPLGESIGQLPAVDLRKGKVLAFDSSTGAPQAGEPGDFGASAIGAYTALSNNGGASGVPSAVNIDDLLVLADGSTTRRDLSDRFAQEFHALDYGAVADGVTDDTAAIKATIKAANDAGGGIVRLPPGTLIIDQMHIGNDKADPGGEGANFYGSNSVQNVRILGSGRGVTTLKALSDGGVTRKLVPTIIGVDNDDCVLAHFTLDCSDLTEYAAPNGSAGGLRMFTSQRCLIHDVEVVSSNLVSLVISGDTFLGIGSQPGLDNVVSNCIVRDQRNYNISVATAQILAGDGARNTTFIGCVSTADQGASSPADLFDAHDAPRTSFVGCYCRGSASNAGGFWSEGSAFTENHVTWTGCRAEGMQVGFHATQNVVGVAAGCLAERCIVGGFWTNGAKNLTVSESTAIECGTAASDDRSAFLMGGQASLFNCSAYRSVGDHSILSRAATNFENATLVVCGGDYDKGYKLFGDGTTSNAQLNVFLSNANLRTIQTFLASVNTITVDGCLFEGEAVNFAGGAEWIKFVRCVFRSTAGGQTCFTHTLGGLRLQVTECDFHDYATVFNLTPASSEFFRYDNYYENTNNEDDPLAVLNQRAVTLSGTSWVALPGTWGAKGVAIVKVDSPGIADGPAAVIAFCKATTTLDGVATVLASQANSGGVALAGRWLNATGAPEIQKTGAGADGAYPVQVL